jgi:hypothetical protein
MTGPVASLLELGREELEELDEEDDELEEVDGELSVIRIMCFFRSSINVFPIEFFVIISKAIMVLPMNPSVIALSIEMTSEEELELLLLDDDDELLVEEELLEELDKLVSRE